MFFIVFLALLLGGFNYFLGHKSTYPFLGIMGIFLGGALGLIVALIAGNFLTTPDDWQKIRTETEIISLSNSTNLSGDFFLGTGSVEGRKMYYYYVDTEKGAINRRLEAKDIYVEEANSSVQPKVVKVRYESKADYVWYIPTDPEEMAPLDEPYTQIIVPKGSIKRQYNPN